MALHSAARAAARRLRMPFSIVLLAGFLAGAGSAQAHGDLHERIEAISLRIQAEPNNADLVFRRAELYREHGAWAEAAADYDRAEALAPEADGVRLGRAQLLQATGEFTAARVQLDRYLAAHPDNAEALATRARVHRQLGDAAHAAEDFAGAIEHGNPPEPDFYLERAQALAASGRIDEALACLDQGSARLGDLPAFGQAAIELESGRGHHEAALQRLDRLRAGARRQEAWLEQRGDLLLRASLPESALQNYRDAQQAIDALPQRIRGTPAMLELGKRLQKKIQSLGPSSP